MKIKRDSHHRSNVLVRSVAVALSGVAISAFGISSHAADEQPVQTAAQERVMSSQLYASPSQVKLVQEALRERGYDPGRVDGIWGESTAQAVTNFQRDKKLVTTGQLDTSLLSALDIGDVLEGETGTSFLDGLLSADRVKAEGAAGNGAPLYVSPVHVAQIQHMLHERGLYKGAIDGIWGESTADAVNDYRDSMGLDPDEGLDIALLRALQRDSKELPNLAAKIDNDVNGVPLRAGPTTLRVLQRELNAKGHEAGNVDGEWGENTRAAVREFQREHDLEPTGTITLPTLAALGIDITGARQAAAEPASTDEPDREVDVQTERD